MSSLANRQKQGEDKPPERERKLVIGVDTGGTFTDLVFVDGQGRARRWKILSTPDDPSRAIIQGLRELLGDFRPEDIEIVHGTTVGTNAFLERKGARTCLITTKGFEDVIFIGRQNRPLLYDFMVDKPEPVVNDTDILGITERTGPDGSVLRELGPEELQKAVSFCKDRRAESVAICLLHSYANGENEKKIASYLEKSGISAYPSCEIIPEFREYERTSTTLINAYLGPVVGGYVEHLEQALPGARIFIQQSNGGCRPSINIGRYAVTTLLSGPAGGVAASMQLAESMGLDQFITLDMGGTSTDVSLCAGDFTYTREYQIQGFPISLPMVDIHTVGAGGGSVAWIDRGGLLKVGPESAGADPGPVCYGKGERLTVTDANLYLGRLRPDDFLGGRMKLHRERVDLLMKGFSSELCVSPEEAALGIIRIVNTNMIQAIRAVSLERGLDPRDFVLVSFGGAAGLHAMELAQALGMKKVLIPSMAGVFSALGMAGSELVFEGSASLFISDSRQSYDRIMQAFKKLQSRIEDSIPDSTAGATRKIRSEWLMDARYKGQSFEITCSFCPKWEREFHRLHKRLYGYCMEEAPLEITAIRCRLRLSRKDNARDLHFQEHVDSGQENSRFHDCQEARIIFEDGLKTVPVIYKRQVKKDSCLSGPLLIIDDFTTVLVPEGWKVAEKKGHLLAQLK
ncbi:MAG: hydantoinase/oxoprolinase family protein [Thermodesulfatator sp.]|nr:MAG: hydantoinase/oxoprolinase family protein [Thermodesulfatator sp.]